MDLGPLRALAVRLQFDNQVGAVDVTVTRPAPDNTPIECRGIWLTYATEDQPGREFGRREARRIMALSKVDVPTVPRGTRIVAPELSGGDERIWQVDGFDRIEADHTRVIVIAIEDES
jgi:hypothetical protein